MTLETLLQKLSDAHEAALVLHGQETQASEVWWELNEVLPDIDRAMWAVKTAIRAHKGETRYE